MAGNRWAEVVLDAPESEPEAEAEAGPATVLGFAPPFFPMRRAQSERSGACSAAQSDGAQDRRSEEMNSGK